MMEPLDNDEKAWELFTLAMPEAATQVRSRTKEQLLTVLYMARDYFTAQALSQSPAVVHELV